MAGLVQQRYTQAVEEVLAQQEEMGLRQMLALEEMVQHHQYLDHQ